jgi:methyl-accepting chemotaxis protein
MSPLTDLLRGPALARELAAVRAERDALAAALHEIGEVCAQAAKGDIEPRVLKVDGPVEAVAVADRVNRLLDLADAYVRESRAALEHASSGRFYRRVLTRGMLGSFRHAAGVINDATDMMAAQDARIRDAEAGRLQMADALEATIKGVVDNLAAAATELSATAQSLSSSAGRTAEQADSAAAAAGSASQAMTAVASAVEELSSTVQEIERQVRESNDAAANAVTATDRTTGTVRDLTEATQEIAGVVGFITQIADQTRLLALNATIEAARAGSAGKGFAVVAAEVKGLADQTSHSTGRITDQVSSMQEASGGAVTAIASIAQLIRQLNDIAGGIAQAVSEQRSATTEISRSIQQVAMGTQDTARAIESVTASTQETSHAAGQMEQASSELSHLAETLRVEVQTFLDRIRGRQPKSTSSSTTTMAAASRMVSRSHAGRP